ncbi:MAG: hypothetical protein ACI80K_004323, partial [Paracoccaceae bacterium]
AAEQHVVAVRSATRTGAGNVMRRIGVVILFMWSWGIVFGSTSAACSMGAQWTPVALRQSVAGQPGPGAS